MSEEVSSTVPNGSDLQRPLISKGSKFETDHLVRNPMHGSGLRMWGLGFRV